MSEASDHPIAYTALQPGTPVQRSDGHHFATGQAPQAGFWAWQQRRPCQIR